MKVFISWSGQRSRLIAESLRNWIPKVIQAIQPWMSKDDISSGSRWSFEIFKELEETSFGIICLTPENQHNPWILFETGALSKSIHQTYVVPYIFEMSPSEISGPIVQFQTSKANRDGSFRLVLALNNALGDKGLSEIELKEVFDVWWHKLEDKLKEIPKFDGEIKDSRSEKDILNEILENTREQLRKEEIRLKSIQGREDEFTNVIKSFQNELMKFGEKPQKIIDLIPLEEGAIKNELGRLTDFDSLGKPFNEMIKMLADQKDITSKLMEKSKKAKNK